MGVAGQSPWGATMTQAGLLLGLGPGANGKEGIEPEQTQLKNKGQPAQCPLYRSSEGQGSWIGARRELRAQTRWETGRKVCNKIQPGPGQQTMSNPETNSVKLPLPQPMPHLQPLLGKDRAPVPP